MTSNHFLQTYFTEDAVYSVSLATVSVSLDLTCKFAW